MLCFTKHVALATLLAGIFCGPLAETARGLVIAEKGHSDYTIVIASDALPSEKHGAEELQMFLEQISGARLPIATDRDPVNGPMILVGQSEKLDTLGLRIDFASLGKEGFVIRTAPPHFVLAGGRPRGSLYAVYTFLEDHLGCRWFTQTVSRIPKRERIDLGPISDRQVPVFEWRDLNYSSGVDLDWDARNKINGNGNLGETRGGKLKFKGFSHTFYALMPPSEYFEEHPEYYSLINGERNYKRGQLCLTNPDVLRLLSKRVKEWLREDPDSDIISVTQKDGFGGACQCPDCAALDEKEGGPSGTMLTFANKVADIVGEEFPNVSVQTNAYTYTRKPPKTIRGRPNVSVRVASGIQNCLVHPVESDNFVHTKKFRAELIEWSKIVKFIYVTEYITNFHHYLVPFPNFDALSRNIKFYADNKVRGMCMFGRTQTLGGEMGELRAYVLAKCLWNPRYDARKAMGEFLDGYYGLAAPPIREYLEMLHKKVRDDNTHAFLWTKVSVSYLAPEIIGRASELFDEAERLVAGDPDLLNRVQVARLGIQYVKLTRPTACGLSQADAWEMLGEFKRLVEKNGVTHTREGGANAPQWIAEKEVRYGPLPEGVVYDLYQSLDQAKAENCRKFERRSTEHDEQKLFVLLQHPADKGNGDATFEVPLPALESGQKLVLGLGTCFTRATENGVRFTVLADGQEAWSSEQQDLAPVDHEVDLSGWAGKTIPLTLRVNAMDNSANDWSCWVHPQIQIVND